MSDITTIVERVLALESFAEQVESLTQQGVMRSLSSALHLTLERNHGNLQVVPDAVALAKEVQRLQKAHDDLAQYHGGHLPWCDGFDEIAMRCACGYLQGHAYRDLVAKVATLTQERDEARKIALDYAYHTWESDVVECRVCGSSSRSGGYAAYGSEEIRHRRGCKIAAWQKESGR